MATFCKDHILDSFSPRFDLANWLEDIFKWYKFDRCSPKIVMGNDTFKIFQLITHKIGMDGRTYEYKGYVIPQDWITIDLHFVDPYYIAIRWEEPEIKTNRDLYGYSIQHVFYDEFIGLDRGHGLQKVPHIDHVIFNCPATIVFWKDGTKTVVKWDGKGRQDKRLAILYAFIRKIYGEGKPYNNILNEIEEALK